MVSGVCTGARILRDLTETEFTLSICEIVPPAVSLRGKSDPSEPVIINIASNFDTQATIDLVTAEMTPSSNACPTFVQKIDLDLG